MPDDSRESSFIMAAEHQVDRLVRAARWSRIAIIVLVVAVLGLGFLYWQQRDIIHSACEGGNSYKAAQTQIWDKLFALSFGYKAPDKHSEVYKLDEEFLSYVSATNAPKNCNQSFP